MKESAWAVMGRLMAGRISGWNGCGWELRMDSLCEGKQESILGKKEKH